ncbi:class A sortase [Tuanshanicoccus lijuaniae]|uniref:class A sortase n=1 Tax=Aerococcaceae bacterium zg-1292 TaxID=2774330 RepID=UPI001BD8EA0A|nr:class A sortase [Aerococcaceae bacterium zg-BR9]MBS4456675.1 class A sortase [Aerococcaceae bacterium zg-A91]MBS4458467.1 class A sortase [Aerococcaceae bacterium zg-BR33]
MAAKTRQELHGKRRRKRRRRRRGGTFRTILGILLILVALGLFAMDPIKNHMIEKGQTQNAIGNLTVEKVRENKKKAVTYNWEEISTLSAYEVIRKNVNPDDLPTIGGIAIPSVNMNLPIYKGVSEAGMYLGAGTLYADQEMGESNYSLASHHSIHKDLLFAPLLRVKNGDLVYLTDLEHVYVYEIDNIRTVPPTAVEVTYPTEKAILTLITCDSALEDRVVVQASLKEKVDINKATPEMVSAFKLPKTVPKE